MLIKEKRAGNGSKEIIWDTNNPYLRGYTLRDAVIELGAYQQGEFELTSEETESQLLDIYVEYFDGSVEVVG